MCVIQSEHFRIYADFRHMGLTLQPPHHYFNAAKLGKFPLSGKNRLAPKPLWSLHIAAKPLPVRTPEHC